MARSPETIGKYKIIAEIARGGMGAVYTAEHPTLSRTVIIKKLTMRGNAAVRERFRREASIMMDFRNEYIVDVFDHFREGPAYYIVQEYVDGMSLSDLLRRERYLPERVALLIFRDCCRALKYAHDRGVIHRDIKPGNILLSRTGDVKLVDFGIAHIDDDNEAALTREGTMLGTPSYMAPEQFQDTRSVDKRADIYSLGVMLYEMTTGKRPFPGSISAETLRLIQHGKYRNPKNHNPAISRYTVRMIRKAMNARRSRRYQDLVAVIKKLDRRFGTRTAGEEKPEIAAFLDGRWSPPRHRSHHLRVLVPTIAVLVVAVAGLIFDAVRSGVALELLHPDRYGTLTVTVRVPRGSRPPGATYVAAELFRDDGASNPRVEGVRFDFHRAPDQSTEETAVFVSRTLYLPAAEYRIKIMGPGELVWKDFYLPPHRRQLEESGRASEGDLTISTSKEASVPLSVSVRVTSAAGGETITGGTNVELYSGEQWVPLTGALAASLRTGSSYRFRLVRSGYYPTEYSLLIYPSQSVLRIEASLVPYAGSLSLSSSTDNLQVRLDGAEIYRTWGPTPHPLPLPSVGKKAVQLILAPGVHTLSAHSGSMTGSYTFTVLKLMRLRLEIVPDRKSGKIRFVNGGYEREPGLAR